MTKARMLLTAICLLALLKPAFPNQEAKQLALLNQAGLPAKFSADGELLATVRADEDQAREVILWESSTWQKRATLKNAGLPLVFSPNGKRLATTREGKGEIIEIKIWDLSTFREVLTLNTKNKGETTVPLAFNSKGDTLATMSFSGGFAVQRIQLWKMPSGEELPAPEQKKGEAIVPWENSKLRRNVEVRFPDEKVLAAHPLGEFQWPFLTTITTADDKLSASVPSIGGGFNVIGSVSDGQIRLVNKHVGLTFHLTGHSDGVTHLEFVRKDDVLLSSDGSEIKFWDVSTGLELGAILQSKVQSGLFPGFPLSPDGKLIAVPTENHGVRVMDLSMILERPRLRLSDRRDPLISFPGKDPIRSVCFSPDGKYVVSDGQGKSLQIWNLSTATLERTLKGHTNTIRSVAFSPDGKHLVSGSWDKSLIIWDTMTGEQKLVLRGHSGTVLDVAYSPDGRFIASASRDKTIKLWDAATGRELATFRGHSNWVSSVSFDTKGNRLVSGSWDKTLKVWDLATRQESFTLKGHTDVVTSVAFHPDRSEIISGSLDKSIKVWGLVSRREIRTLTDVDSVIAVIYSPDGKRIISGGVHPLITVWDSENGKSIFHLKGHDLPVTTLAASSDGRFLATGSNDKTLRMWSNPVERESSPSEKKP